MDLIDKIRVIAERVRKQAGQLKTEEATKNAFVMPFIQALGYDVFDPTEVTPEFTADVGTKKGEKVDYAVLRDGKPIILFECKFNGVGLQDTHKSQLFRYFSVTDARIAVLTNGIEYWFFTDIDKPNMMDDKPFLELDMLDIREPLVEELKKVTKESFNLEDLLSAANELKYTKEIKRIMLEQLESTDDGFVRFFADKIYSGKKLTQSVLEQFAGPTKRALRQVINDKINERLKRAQVVETAPQVPANSADDSESEADGDPRIVTTEEEIEGFHIVKAILREVIDLNRVADRDGVAYFAVLLDDNNRKPICRLHFNGVRKKYLGLFDADKNEEKVLIDDLNEIYDYSDKIKAVVQHYDRTRGDSSPGKNQQTVNGDATPRNGVAKDTGQL